MQVYPKALTVRRLGRVLRAARKFHDFTLKEVAALAGIKVSRLHHWEQGTAAPSLLHLQVLCYVLRLDPAFLYSTPPRSATSTPYTSSWQWLPRTSASRSRSASAASRSSGRRAVVMTSSRRAGCLSTNLSNEVTAACNLYASAVLPHHAAGDTGQRCRTYFLSIPVARRWAPCHNR